MSGQTNYKEVIKLMCNVVDNMKKDQHIRLKPQGTVINNLWPDLLAGSKALIAPPFSGSPNCTCFGPRHSP